MVIWERGKLGISRRLCGILCYSPSSMELHVFNISGIGVVASQWFGSGLLDYRDLSV